MLTCNPDRGRTPTFRPRATFQACSRLGNYSYTTTRLGSFAANITTISSRQFNRATSAAKRAAAEGPVFITDRGRPAHVLLSIEGYRKLTGQVPSIGDMLAMPEAADIQFDPPRSRDTWSRLADLS